MRNVRKYGTAPFTVAVIHGGPGAPGEMAPVARELADGCGVLEPLQTATSLNGQVHELQTIVHDNSDLSATLIGWSWGAWLSFILTARYPALVKKLILIGSGPFEEHYAATIMQTRLHRLSAAERAEVRSLMAILNDTTIEDKNTPMTRLGTLLVKADAYDPLPPASSEILEYQYDIHQRVWAQARKFRRSGKLLALGSKIRCPVVAIHGDYDPHPSAGVKEPLSRVLKDFRFVLLEQCGHCPWIERNARDRFYTILKNEVEC